MVPPRGCVMNSLKTKNKQTNNNNKKTVVSLAQDILVFMTERTAGFLSLGRVYGYLIGAALCRPY